MGNSKSKSVVKVGKGNTEDLSHTELREILRTQLHLPVNCSYLHVNDRDYITVDENRLKAFAEKDSTSELKYKAEVADCDDFTFVMLGEIKKNLFKYGSNGNRALAVGQIQGVLWKNDDKGEKHAMVIYINKDKKVRFLEPQNDKIYKPNDKNSYWLVQV